MTVTPKDPLDSWKEIATFLNRGVRTVQRWEATEAFLFAGTSIENWGRCLR